MKRLPSIVLAVAAFGLVPALVSPAVAASPASAPAAPGDPQPAVTSMIVAYEPGVAPAEATGEASGSSDVTVTSIAPGEAIGFGLRTVTLAEPLSIDSAEALATELTQSPEIAWAEPDRIVTLDAAVDVAASQVIGVGGPWGLDRVDERALPLDSTYQYTTDGTGVTAYVIDTGILSTHTEFTGRLDTGFSALAGFPATEDCEGHGTHVAGTIGGNTYGVAKQVTLVPVRVFPCAPTTSISDVISGANWVVGNHAAGTPAVANMSLTVSPVDAGLDLAVQAMINDGITVVAASGNSSTDACTASPAHIAAAITVNASTSLDAFATFSDFGSCTDLYAPGDNILSAGITVDPTTLTATPSGPVAMSGTSMASPHVAGAAARILSASPTLTPAQVSTAITSAATVPVPAVSRGGTDPNRLLYLGPTSAPSAVAAAPSDAATVVTWSSPLLSGGTSITSYTATAWNASSGGTPQGTCQPSPLTALTCTVGSLINGTTYYVDALATNADGASAASTRIPVTPAARPSAPQSLLAVAGASSAVVSWGIPASNGGSAITSYTATAWSAASGGLSRGTCQPSPLTGLTCTITGLANGTPYFVDAVATNAAGSSIASARAPVTPVAPATAPTAPRSPTALAGDGSAVLTWVAPSSPGSSAITSYTATAWDAAVGGTSRGTCQPSPLTGLTCTITGLANATTYYVDIIATNGSGAGTPSARVAVTPVASAPPTGGGGGGSASTSSDSADTGGGGSAPAPVVVVAPVAPPTVPSAPVTPSVTTTVATVTFIGPASAGVVRPSAAQATSIRLTSVAPAAATAGKAPTASTKHGTIVRLSVPGLPASTKVAVQIKVGGSFVRLGSVTTSAAGRATLPAMKPTKPGTYLVRITDPSGARHYVKLVVR